MGDETLLPPIAELLRSILLSLYHYAYYVKPHLLFYSLYSKPIPPAKPLILYQLVVQYMAVYYMYADIRRQ